MAEFPALPLWTDAYLADTGHLDDAEHGRYLLILIHLWRTPAQRFPNDIGWLARKFRRSVQAFENELLPLMREFCQCDGNWWTQKRLKAEWDYVSRRHKAQSERAKRRWNKQKTDAGADAALHRSGNAPTPTPTPIEETPSLRSGVLAAHDQNGRGKPATRLSPDWQPSPENLAFAIGLGLDGDAIAANFRDYWIAASGAKARKHDWDATWRGWCRREHDRAKPTAPNGHARSDRQGAASFVAATARVLARLEKSGKG